MDVYGIYNYSIHGGYKPTYRVWGPHLVGFGAPTWAFDIFLSQEGGDLSNDT